MIQMKDNQKNWNKIWITISKKIAFLLLFSAQIGFIQMKCVWWKAWRCQHWHIQRRAIRVAMCVRFTKPMWQPKQLNHSFENNHFYWDFKRNKQRKNIQFMKIIKIQKGFVVGCVRILELSLRKCCHISFSFFFIRNLCIFSHCCGWYLFNVFFSFSHSIDLSATLTKIVLRALFLWHGLRYL